MSIFNSTLLCVAVAVVPLLAFAQHKTRPDPADAALSASAASHESTFDRYIPDRDVEPAGWKEVNDEVGQFGGHVGLMRGATGSAGRPAAPAGKAENKPAAESVKPAARGHAGHHR